MPPRAGEQRALRLIGLAFFALALYILVQAAVLNLSGARPHTSARGVAMLLLAPRKGVTGRQLGNLVLQKEGHVTRIDAALAGRPDPVSYTIRG